MPFAEQRRGDEADRGRIEAVEQHDDETHGKNQPLELRKAPSVDEILNVDGVGNCHRLPPCLVLCFLTGVTKLRVRQSS